MLQHIDSDDEDDYEGYFLQPAQGYDIAEKIKQANQELNEIPVPTTPINRVVRFRTVLEDYEPDYDENTSNSKLNEVVESEHFEIITENIAEEIQEMIITVSDQLTATEDNTPKHDEHDFEDEIIFEDEMVESVFEEVTFTTTIGTAQETNTTEELTEATPPNNGGQPEIKKNPLPKKTKNKKPEDCSPQPPINGRRLCCHSKMSKERQSLPKYDGFYSEYGLSKDQLDHRQKIVENRLQSKFNRQMEKVNERNNRLCKNEEAFATWLYKKMKAPFNYKKNMYNSNVKSKKK